MIIEKSTRSRGVMGMIIYSVMLVGWISTGSVIEAEWVYLAFLGLLVVCLTRACVDALMPSVYRLELGQGFAVYRDGAALYNLPWNRVVAVGYNELADQRDFAALSDSGVVHAVPEVLHGDIPALIAAVARNPEAASVLRLDLSSRKGREKWKSLRVRGSSSG